MKNLNEFGIRWNIKLNNDLANQWGDKLQSLNQEAGYGAISILSNKMYDRDEIKKPTRVFANDIYEYVEDQEGLLTILLVNGLEQDPDSKVEVTKHVELDEDEVITDMIKKWGPCFEKMSDDEFLFLVSEMTKEYRSPLSLGADLNLKRLNNRINELDEEQIYSWLDALTYWNF